MIARPQRDGVDGFIADLADFGVEAVVQGPVGGSTAPNWIDYDESTDDFWLVSGGMMVR